jgi:hypothetical protein
MQIIACLKVGYYFAAGNETLGNVKNDDVAAPQAK